MLECFTFIGILELLKYFNFIKIMKLNNEIMKKKHFLNSVKVWLQEKLGGFLLTHKSLLVTGSK